MPIAPAWGAFESPHTAVSTMQVPRPRQEETMAPAVLTHLVKSPQRKGPKKTDAMAPQEMESTVTITPGLE